jgi:hypothetical protein
MDWPTASVAIAAALGTSGVAIYSLIHQREEAEKDRANDRETRRQERRAAAYVELITALERQQMQVDRTAPVLDLGAPPPPPSLSDEELWHLNALAGVLASDPVRELILAWTRKWSQFHIKEVWYLGQVQDHQKFHKPSETKADFGVTALEQWQKVEATRVQLREGLQEITRQLRAEL